MSYLEDEASDTLWFNHICGKTERIEEPYLKPEEKDIWKASIAAALSRCCVCTYREHRAFLHSIATGAPPLVGSKVGHDAIHISLAAERSCTLVSR